MWPTEDGIVAAVREVRAKSDPRIEGDTAEAWGYRALACYRIAAATKAPARVRGWLDRAKGYADEALEHAALTRDQGKTLRVIEKALAAARVRAQRTPRSARGRHGHASA